MPGPEDTVETMEDEFLVTKLPSGARRDEIVQFFKKLEVPYRVSSKINDLTGFVQYAQDPSIIRSNEGFYCDFPDKFTPRKIGRFQRQVEERDRFPGWKSNQREPFISQGNSVPKNRFGGFQRLAAEHSGRTFQSNPSGLNPFAVQGTSARPKFKSGFGDSHFSSFSTSAMPARSTINKITGSPKYGANRPQASRRFLMGATPEAWGIAGSTGSWSIDSTENEQKKQAASPISQTVQPPQTPFSLRKGFEKKKVAQKTGIVEDLVKQKKRENFEEKQPPRRIVMEITLAGSRFMKNDGSSSIESTVEDVEYENPPNQPSQFAMPEFSLGKFDEPSVIKDADVEDLHGSGAVEELMKTMKKVGKGSGGTKTGEKQAEAKKTSKSKEISKKERGKTVESLIGTASFFAHLEQIATESMKTSPYRCDICARQFTCRYNLRNHRTTHEY